MLLKSKEKWLGKLIIGLNLRVSWREEKQGPGVDDWHLLSWFLMRNHPARVP